MRKLLLIPAALLLMAGCGNDPHGTTVIQSGRWSGLTFDSTAVAFSVTDNAVRDMTITFEHDFGAPEDTTVTWVFNADITDDQFQYSELDGSGPWEFGLSMDGTFSPPDHVSGDVTTWASYTEGGSTESDTLQMVWSATPE